MKGGKMDMGCYGTHCVPGRSFLTKAEKIGMLKDYQNQLEQEAKGVAERIKGMQSEIEEE